jgi:hypothetical protein
MAGIPGFHAAPEDVRLARRSFDRVLLTLQRLAAEDRLGGRTAQQAGVQIWALVHGLVSLEMRGVLGTPSQAERAWRDAVETTVPAYATTPPPDKPTRRARSSSTQKATGRRGG